LLIGIGKWNCVGHGCDLQALCIGQRKAILALIAVSTELLVDPGFGVFAALELLPVPANVRLA